MDPEIWTTRQAAPARDPNSGFGIRVARDVSGMSQMSRASCQAAPARPSAGKLPKGCSRCPYLSHSLTLSASLFPPHSLSLSPPLSPSLSLFLSLSLSFSLSASRPGTSARLSVGGAGGRGRVPKAGAGGRGPGAEGRRPGARGQGGFRTGAVTFSTGTSTCQHGGARSRSKARLGRGRAGRAGSADRGGAGRRRRRRRRPGWMARPVAAPRGVWPWARARWEICG